MMEFHHMMDHHHVILTVILICQSYISDTFTFLLYQYLFLSISIINTINCIFAVFDICVEKLSSQQT